MIPPDIPDGADVLFVGEDPGREEDGRGRCFIGKTGREYNERYLPLAGLSRSEVGTTNTVKCYLHGRDPDPELVRSCSHHHLKRELEIVKPRLVVPMGATACSIFTDMDSDAGINLEMQYAKLLYCTGLEGFWSVFPMYHPALGLHDTGRMLQIEECFRRLKELLAGRLVSEWDPYEDNEDYRWLRSVCDLDVIDDHSLTAPMAIDTETVDGKMWCLTFSLMPGTGYLIRSNDRTMISEFKDRLNARKGMILFHNWLYDVPVLADAGIYVPPKKTDDTMMRAYHLGNMPQALKILAYRLCGMHMQEYEDLVMPYAIDEAISYFMTASSVDWPKPPSEMVLQDDGTYKKYSPQGLNTKLKRLFTDFSKNPNTDLFKRYENWSDSERNMLMARFGELPRPRIDQVPMDKVIRYACRDADATLRVWPLLKGLQREMRTRTRGRLS